MRFQAATTQLRQQLRRLRRVAADTGRRSEPTPPASPGQSKSRCSPSRTSRQVSWQWGANGFSSTAESRGTDQHGRRRTTHVRARRSPTCRCCDRAAADHASRSRAGRACRSSIPMPSFDRTFAAYAFSEPAQYTAQIIGADGAVLAIVAVVRDRDTSRDHRDHRRRRRPVRRTQPQRNDPRHRRAEVGGAGCRRSPGRSDRLRRGDIGVDQQRPKVAPVTSTSLAPPHYGLAAAHHGRRRPLVPYYAADPPRQYSVQFADTQGPGAGFDPARQLPVVGNAGRHVDVGIVVLDRELCRRRRADLRRRRLPHADRRAVDRHLPHAVRSDDCAVLAKRIGGHDADVVRPQRRGTGRGSRSPSWSSDSARPCRSAIPRCSRVTR